MIALDEVWDLRYINDRRVVDVPTGWPGAAVYASLSVLSGTLTNALELKRWRETGAHALAGSPTIDDSTTAQLTADDLQGVSRLAVVNPAAQTCLVRVVVEVEQKP